MMTTNTVTCLGWHKLQTNDERGYAVSSSNLHPLQNEN